jgi:regulator of RNase E activity RraA
MTPDPAKKTGADAGRLGDVERLAKLYTAVVADCMDRVGLRNQVMAPRIRPLFPEAKMAGIAATVDVVDIDEVPPDRDAWYKGELQAVDALTEGEVMVVSRTTGSYWGELLATAARYRGARGIVVDGFCRDTVALIDMKFPTFAAGILCSDSLGRIDVRAAGVPVVCGDITVNPGDLVLADHDGIVVLPRHAAGEVLGLAEEKVSGENLVRDELARGRSLWETFRTYGVI